MENIKERKLTLAFYKVGVLSMAFFAVVVSLFFNAPVIKNASATTNTQVDIDVVSLVSLSVNDTVNLGSIIPGNGQNVFASNGVTAYVTTNNSTGYSLLMYADGSNASMVNSDNGNVTIDSDFNGSVTSSTMGTNKWGYSLNDTDFYAVPLASNAATIARTDTIAENRATTVYYGASVANDIPAGVYEKTIVFVAYANADNIDPADRTIFDIYYMQDMTSTICSNTTTPSVSATDFAWVDVDDASLVPRATLVDNRDGTTYLVSKLADGNCWMSQNLELEIDSEGYSNANTDLNSKASWVATNSTRVSTDSSWQSSDWDAEKSIETGDEYRYLRNGRTPASTPTSNAFNHRWERTGIHYNHAAATATNNFYNGSTADSICPKGWELPSATGTKSFDDLIFNTYGLSASTGDMSKIISVAPLNFVFAGSFFDYSSTTPSSIGSTAAYWTKTIEDERTADYLKSYVISGEGWGSGTITIDSNGGYKDSAMSIRCVAK